MADIMLGSPNEKRDCNQTVKVLPGEVKPVDRTLDCCNLTQTSVKNTRQPICGMVSWIQDRRNSVSLWSSTRKVRTLDVGRISNTL